MKESGLRLGFVGFAAVFGCVFGCSEPQVKTESFDIVFFTKSDDKRALPGSGVALRGQKVGITDTEGMLKSRVKGLDGESLSVAVTCPEGYSDPQLLPKLKLARVKRLDRGSTAADMVYEATCTREVREVLLVVAAQNAPEVPVQIDGNDVGRTDPYGRAHVLLTLPNSVKEVTLALNTEGLPDLRPVSPMRVFEVGMGDDLLLFTQEFSVKKKTRKHRPVIRKEPERHIPYRVD